MASCCAISTFIFILVKKYGRKFVYDFCDKRHIKKIENSKLFQDTKKIEWIMFILFLIPGTPKDLLVYLAGLLPIKLHRFVIITTIARFPSVITSTLAGDNLMDGNWKLSIILYLSIVLVVLLIVSVINKFDKSKTTQSVIQSIGKDI